MRAKDLYRPQAWMSGAAKGAESIIKLTLESRGDVTDVTLLHSGVPGDELGRQQEEGWTFVLSALAGWPAAGRATRS